MTIGTARVPFMLAVNVLWGYAGAALLVAIVTGGDSRAPSIFAVAAAVLLSFAIARVLAHTDLALSQARTVGIVATVIALWLIMHFEYAPGRWLFDLAWLADFVTSPLEQIEQHSDVVAGGFALLVFWLRGIASGLSSASFEDVLPVTAFGLVVVAIAAIADPSARWPESFGVIAIAYLVVALGTLALYQAPEPRTPITSFAARWTPAVVAMLAVAALAALVVAAIDADELGVFEPVLGPAGYVLRTAAFVVIAPIFFVVGGVFHAISWLIAQFFGDVQPFEPPEIIGGEELLPEEDERESPAWLRVLGAVAATTGALALVGVALLIVWFAFRRFARAGEDERERREDIEPAYTLRDDLNALLGAFTNRFRRTRAPHYSGVAVRRLYFEMLDRAAGDGVARPSSATPLQFAPLLDDHFRSDAPSSITQAFVDSRYGEYPVDDAVVRSLETQWRAIAARRPPDRPSSLSPQP